MHQCTKYYVVILTILYVHHLKWNEQHIIDCLTDEDIEVWIKSGHIQQWLLY